jgi:hypothetical protein
MKHFHKILKNALLLIIFPVLWWGPMVHPHINRLALRKAEKELASGNTGLNEDLIRRLEANEEAFIFAGNSADAISMNHILNNVSVYDYAHNAIPDTFEGSPQFGQALIDEWRQAYDGQRDARYSDRDFAVACGWLAHQLADWYPHYASTDGSGRLVGAGRQSGDGIKIFSGLANSHRVLGTDYYPEILNKYEVIDHALIELFYDLLTLQDHRKELKKNHVEFFDVKDNRCLLTATSERYIGKAARIPPEIINELWKTHNFVIRGLRSLLKFLSIVRPGTVSAIRNTIDPKITGATDYISLSADHVVNGLFSLSYNEINRRAAENLLAKDVANNISVKKPGHLLYPILRELGIFADMHKAFLFPEQFYWTSKMHGGIVFENLVSFLDNHKKIAYTQRNHDAEALLCFLSELILRDHQDLSVPLEHFRQTVRPVIEFDAAGGSEEENLKQMLRSRRLTLRFIPATSPVHPEDNKLLHRNQLNFKIDGYDVSLIPESYLLTESWEGKVLTLTCYLLKPPRMGVHNLFVDISDQGGTSARYLEFEFEFRKSATGMYKLIAP